MRGHAPVSSERARASLVIPSLTRPPNVLSQGPRDGDGREKKSGFPFSAESHYSTRATIATGARRPPVSAHTSAAVETRACSPATSVHPPALASNTVCRAPRHGDRLFFSLKCGTTCVNSLLGRSIGLFFGVPDRVGAAHIS